jgi:hypothetical protein
MTAVETEVLADSSEQLEVAETDIILPEPANVVLSNGVSVEIKPLKARQFFALLRILTRGAAYTIDLMRGVKDPEGFVNLMTSAIIMAVPEAPDATFAFLKSVVTIETKPDGKFTADGLAVNDLLDDPEIEDVITIVERIVADNREDLIGLGKRLMSAFGIAQKVGEIPKA